MSTLQSDLFLNTLSWTSAKRFESIGVTTSKHCLTADEQFIRNTTNFQKSNTSGLFEPFLYVKGYCPIATKSYIYETSKPCQYNRLRITILHEILRQYIDQASF